jgi:hypothetical protein
MSNSRHEASFPFARRIIMGDDEQQRPVRVCLTRCPLPPADESVHSLPCHIHHDGPAAIKSYFRPEQEVDGDPRSWRAEFRGVQLRGQRVSLQTMGMQGAYSPS